MKRVLCFKKIKKKLTEKGWEEESHPGVDQTAIVLMKGTKQKNNRSGRDGEGRF